MTVIPMTKRVIETFEKPTYSVQIVLQSYNAEVTVCNIQGSKDYILFTSMKTQEMKD